MTVQGKGGRPKKSDPGKWDKYWKYEGSIWKSESAWFSWIRSTLRRGWNRNPTKIAKLKKELIQIPNPNPKSATRFPTVKGGKCSCCSGVFPMSGGKKEGKHKVTIQVDHLEPSGSLRDVSHFQGFVERLFCVGLDDLALICSVCNKTKDLAWKKGISFEQATAERQAIALQKEKKDVEWLAERGLSGKNATVRRKMIVEQIMKESGNG